ncbi:MAG TPA: AI-2E family transporter [Vicinamibacterales bacterium]
MSDPARPSQDGIELAPTPLSPTPGAPGEPAPVVVNAPVGVTSLTLTVLTSIAVVVTLQYMQAVLVPIVIGILVAYGLEPFVAALARARIRRSIGAGIVLTALVGILGLAVYALSGEALQIVAQIPQAAQRIQERVRSHVRRRNSAIDQVQKAATELQKTAEVASTTDRDTPPKDVTKVQVVQPAFDANSYLYAGGVNLLAATGQAAVVFFLVYFFLVTGNLYKRKIVKIAGPHLWQKKLTVEILDEINSQIGSFIGVQLLTSALVAAATMAALWYFGLRQYVIWGLLAGIFNSIPYLGPVLVTGGLGIVGFLQFDDVPKTLLVCGVAFVITSVEGFLLTPALMGRASRMNPVAIFLGLLFWSWIWGVWGAVLAVPMLMMIKAVSDHIEDLQPLGELLGE